MPSRPRALARALCDTGPRRLPRHLLPTPCEGQTGSPMRRLSEKRVRPRSRRMRAAFTVRNEPVQTSHVSCAPGDVLPALLTSIPRADSPSLSSQGFAFRS